MKRIILMVVSFYVATIFACLFAQQVLPMDTAVRYGKLPNGLTYYIRHSDSNGSNVNMYLLQNVGSVLEEEHERGLAHFLEHMAFNGTKNLPGLSMRKYLDEKGLVFGRDYNASTGYDETIYELNNISGTDSAMVDSCMLIIRDMACNLTLDDEMIEKERNIVLSELNRDNTPENRVAYSHARKLFADGERYGTHFSIGKADVIKNFKPETLREFYRKWYRPDLQAVVVIGGIDVDSIESKIKELWAEVSAPQNPLPRKDVEVSLHKGILPIVEVDKNFPSNMLILDFKIPDMPLDKKGTYEDYKLVVEFEMLRQVMNTRLMQMQKANQSTFIEVDFSRSDYYGARWVDLNKIIATVYPDKWQDAMLLIEKEVKQMREYGVGEMEFEQAKGVMRKMFEAGRKQAFNKVNTDYFYNIKTNYFNKEVLVDDQQFYSVIGEIIDGFTVADFNKHVAEAFTDDNIVLSLIGNEDLSPLPSEQQLAQLYTDYYNQIEVTREERVLKPLMPASNLLDASEIVGYEVDSTSINGEYPTHYVTFSNGANVMIRRCDIETDKISLVAYRKGGGAQFDKNDYKSYSNLGYIVDSYGFGGNKHDDIAQWYMNSGYQYALDFNENENIITMVSSHEDLDEMFTHLQLMFAEPVKDEARFEQWKVGMEEMLKSVSRTPEGLFSDSVSVASYGYNNPYMQLLSATSLNIDYDKACEIYSRLFSNASEYTFVIVGDMEEEKIIEYAAKYIGVIPGEKIEPTKVEPLAIETLPGLKLIDFECDEYESELIKVNYSIVAPLKYNGENAAAVDVIEMLLSDYLIEELREKRGVIYSPTLSIDLLRPPYDEVMLIVSLDVVPGYEMLSISLVDEFIEKISNGEIPVDRFSVIKDILLKDAQYEYNIASYPLTTALEEVMYGTDYKFNEDLYIYYLEEEDVITVAKVLDDADCRKLVIMRPSSKKND